MESYIELCRHIALAMALVLGLSAQTRADGPSEHCRETIAMTFVRSLGGGCNDHYRLTAHGIVVQSQIMARTRVDCMGEVKVVWDAVNARANSTEGDKHRAFCELAAQIANSEAGDVVEQR